MSSWDAILYLENGTFFEGQGFGARCSSGGEAVFNTGMTGYQEVFTDPSYKGQVVALTPSHVGNTGVNGLDMESAGTHLGGVIVREYCEVPSSWRSEKNLAEWLAERKVPMVSGIDTRELTQILREEGAQRCIIFPKEDAKGKDIGSYGKQLLSSIPPMEGLELVSQVSTKEIYEFEPKVNPNGPRIAVYDFGIKANILRSLKAKGFNVTVVPYNTPHQEVMSLKPKAIMLSNGPGDPALVPEAPQQIAALVGKLPMLAICMGHQLLGLALGASTYKLKFGHHGVNHPVKDLQTGKILITSHNHGFAVSLDSLSKTEIKPSFVSLNDNTVEGYSSVKSKFLSVQFHPEAAPGPHDADPIFDQFIRGYLA